MRKIIFFIILILLFQGFVNVQATPPKQKPVYNVLNLELLPFENDAFEIKEETFSLDLRGMKEGEDSHAELLAEYRLVNTGTARKAQFALPFIAGAFGAESFSPKKILVNGNEAEATLYMCESRVDYHAFIDGYPPEIDFYKEFAEAASADFRLPEMTGSLYTFTGFPKDTKVNLDLEITEGTKIIYDYGVHIVNGENIRLTFQSYWNTSYKLFIIGEVKEINPTKYEKTDMTLESFFEEYFFVDRPKEKLIADYFINKFLDSSETCVSWNNFNIIEDPRLWYYVFEADVLGNNATNTIEISYPLEIYKDDDYSPDVYEFRYFTSPTNYWKTYEKLKIRIYPGALTKHLLENNFGFLANEDYLETEITSDLDDCILLRFSKSKNPKLDSGMWVVALILLLIYAWPIIVLIIAGIIILVVVLRRRKRRIKALQEKGVSE